MPSRLADTGLVLAATPVRVPTVRQAVRHVARRALPVGFTLAVHGIGGVPHATLATPRAVVGARIHPGREEAKRKRKSERLSLVCQEHSSHVEPHELQAEDRTSATCISWWLVVESRGGAINC